MIIVTVLLGSIASAQAPSPGLSPVAEDGTGFYHGAINGRFEIILTVTRNGGSISGSYQYATQRQSLELQGSVLPNGKLRITEYPAPGVRSGEFFLEGAPGPGQLNGTWRSANGRRSYAVHLEKIEERQYRELQTQWDARQAPKASAASARQQSLFQRLVSYDENTRNEAVREAQRLSPGAQRKIISQLISTLSSEGLDSYYASLSLSGLGEPAIAPLSAALHSFDKGARYRAAEALGRIGLPALDAATVTLADPSPQVQCAAAHALEAMRVGAAPSVPALTALLRSSSIEVKRCVVAALGATRSAEALGALRSELKDTSLQAETLNALTVMQKGASEATPDVLPLLKSDKALTRQIAVRTLGKIAPPSPQVLAALTASLQDADRITREEAVTALGDLGPTAAPAVPLLRQFLLDHSDTGRWLRPRTAEALGKIGPGAAGATSDLIALWVDEFSYARRSAVEAVGRIGPAAIPALMVAMRDADPRIRSGAAWQLGEFHAAGAVSLLIAGLGDKDPTVQAAARQALEKIGTPEAKQAIATSSPPRPSPELQTPAQVESPIPPGEGRPSPLELVSKTSLRGPGGISLLVTVHRSDDRGDLVRIWKPVDGRFLLIRRIDSGEEDPSVAAYEEPEGFRLSGEYFIHLMLLFSGTGFSHEDTFLWIAPDATLHEVKFVKPAGQYDGLHEGEGVWKGEGNTFHDDDATFSFGIWRDGDANCCPTGGEVEGHYKLIGQKHYSSATRKWSADFQIVPADFKRL